jgi:hypothetical protein
MENSSSFESPAAKKLRKAESPTWVPVPDASVFYDKKKLTTLIRDYLRVSSPEYSRDCVIEPGSSNHESIYRCLGSRDGGNCPFFVRCRETRKKDVGQGGKWLICEVALGHTNCESSFQKPRMQQLLENPELCSYCIDGKKTLQDIIGYAARVMTPPVRLTEPLASKLRSAVLEQVRSAGALYML